jgi:hypothetical protein
MKIVTKSALAALIAATCLPGLASAQDSRLSISVTPAVATSSGDSQLAVAGSVGYRFSSHFTFEGEVTWIDAATGGVRDRNFNFDPRVSAATTVSAVLQNVNAMFGGNTGRNPGNMSTPNRPGPSVAALACRDRPAETRGSGRWASGMNRRYRPRGSVRTCQAAWA